MWFKVTWPSGLVSHMQSEVTSPAALAMERWGQNSLEHVHAMGVSIEEAAHADLVALGLAAADQAPSEPQAATPDQAATAETAPTSEIPETTDSTPLAPEANG